jgi:hypothetical protein
MKVVIDSECELWSKDSPIGTKARAYLQRRGLEDAVLLEHYVGCNTTERHLTVDGLEGKVWVPAGITIPLFHASTNTLYGINVRLSGEARTQWKAATGRDTKYLLGSGSKRAPLGLDSIEGKSHAFVLEGEFDMMLILQALQTMGEEAAHVGAITMGSATSQDVDKWLLLHPALLSPRRFLIATDGDGPGQQAAQRWLQITPGRARLWPPPIPFKDVTELWQKHGYEGVRSWISLGLERHT